jgi:hypothetical protein
MTNYPTLMSNSTLGFSNQSQHGLGLASPMVVVHTASGSYSVGDVISFNVSLEDELVIVGAMVGLSRKTPASGNNINAQIYKQLAYNNTATPATISVTLGTTMVSGDNLIVTAWVAL